MEQPRLSVIVPCFDEEANIRRFEGELVPALQALRAPHEIVAVDDGSQDQSASALRELEARRLLRAISHPSNLGMGRALRTGFAAAHGEWIATLDADLTFHPAQLRALLDRQKETGADLVSGSPFLAPEGSRQVPWARRLPSLMVNAFYRGLFDWGFTAYTPLFRLYRASALKALPLESAGFEINAEIAARFHLAGLRLAEAPAILGFRRAGKSKLRPWRELKAHARLLARLLSERHLIK